MSESQQVEYRNGAQAPTTASSDDWLQPPPEQGGLNRYVQTIRERIWIVVAAIAITTAIAILYVLTASKVYEATADLLIIPASNQDGLVVTLPLIQQSSDPTRDVETASRLVTNNDVAVRVAKVLKSPQTPAALLGNVSAEPLAQSNIVDVSAQAATPEDAAQLANAFARQTIAEQTEQLHAFIDDVLPGLQKRAKGDTSGTATDALNATIAELQAKRVGPDPTIRISTEATPPAGPISPRPLLSVVAGIFAGIVLGLAAAFALQTLDTRLRREEQLRRLYRLPILARIPKESHTADSPLDPLALSPAASEAYRTLRGTLAVARRSGGTDSRAILVTGSSASEGKTTTGINLATSLAAAGNSVILIESDLRRPSIGRALGVKPTHGVVSVLIESIALEDALVTTEQFGSNLGLLLADYEGGWISELFALPATRELIEHAKEIADYVIIDSAPLTDVVDALPLVGYVDDVLLVVRLGRTQLAKLERLGELLAENGIKPAGFAVIGTPRPTSSDYHYYGAKNERRSLRSATIGGRS
jgi:capsular exopolysaccharide synthesis family protein